MTDVKHVIEVSYEDYEKMKKHLIKVENESAGRTTQNRFVAQFTNILSQCECVAERYHDNITTVGDILKVRIQDMDDVETLLVHLIYDEEQKQNGVENISLTSPMGLAILGREIGSKVTYSVHNEVLEATILERILAPEQIHIGDTFQSVVRQGNIEEVKLFRLIEQPLEHIDGIEDISVHSTLGSLLYGKCENRTIMVPNQGDPFVVIIGPKVSLEQENVACRNLTKE